MVCFGFTFWFRWQCHNLGLWLRLVKESWGEENPSPAVWRSPSVPDPNPELCDGCWNQERARETLVQKQTGRLCPSHWRRMSAAAPVAYPPSGMHALARQQQQQLPAFLREWRGEVRRARFLPSARLLPRAAPWRDKRAAAGAWGGSTRHGHWMLIMCRPAPAGHARWSASSLLGEAHVHARELLTARASS